MLIRDEYRASRPPKYFMPKSSGMQRTITVLPVIDALVFQSIANHIATKVFHLLADNNDFVFGSVLHEEVSLGLKVLDGHNPEYYFFKPWQLLYKTFADSVNKAVRDNKVEYKFETDITGFYDSIPHYNLLTKISDMTNLADDVLDLLSDSLNTWSGTRDRATPGVGIPQSTGSSHFFANLFLHELDNAVRLEGLPYYRYMDDIRIYGYKKEELQRVLTKIDAHLKQDALSLNAKKTKIEIIESVDRKEPAIDFTYEIDAPGPNDQNEFLDFAEQEGRIDLRVLSTNAGKAKKELIRLCYRDIKEVKRRISSIVSTKTGEEIDIDNRNIQREFINLAYKFRQAINILREFGRKPRLPKAKTLRGWLFLAEHYFWCVNHFCWILKLYENEKNVKKQLFKLIKKYKMYEWVQSELYQCLALSQNFTHRELRELLQELCDEKSWYAKRSIYYLLLHHLKDPQFSRSLFAHIKQEKNETLKRELLFMSGLCKEKEFDRKKMVEAFGIE